MDKIRLRIKESIETKERMLQNKEMLQKIKKAADKIIKMYKENGVVFFAGNGGSAADAQHLAGELVSRFYLERKGLAAQALTVDTSILTGIGNDYGFDKIFARQIEANAKKGDIFIGISTSGNSKNILEAIKEAKEKEMFIIGFTGETGGKMKEECDILLNVPSKDTPRVQESHILIGHILCEIVESEMFA